MQPELPFQTHSKTSRRAAVAGKPRAETQRAIVLAAIIAAGPCGLTDQEGMVITGIGEPYRPRRIGLTQAGTVIDSGRTRLTTSGRSATVWVHHTHLQEIPH